MCLEGETRRDEFVGVAVIIRERGGIKRELGTRFHGAQRWKGGGGPNGEAGGVAVVTSWGGGIEKAVEVELFAGVVLVDVGGQAAELVRAVFDGVDSAGYGVFGYADRVAEAPAEEETGGGVVVGFRGSG